jgi:hypothetical protein
VYRFFQRDWFCRVWVIQEVQQCLNVWMMCGTNEVPLDLVALAGNWVTTTFWFDPNRFSRNAQNESIPNTCGLQNIVFMWDRYFRTRRESPLLALFSHGRRFNATDPRDRIFAMRQHRISDVEASKHLSTTNSGNSKVKTYAAKPAEKERDQVCIDMYSRLFAHLLLL